MRRLSLSVAAGRRAAEAPEDLPRDRLRTVAAVAVAELLAVEFVAPVAASVAPSVRA